MAGARLVITVEMTDDSDFEWIRNRAVPAVEEVVDTAKEEERLDSAEMSVSWEQLDS